MRPSRKRGDARRSGGAKRRRGVRRKEPAVRGREAVARDGRSVAPAGVEPAPSRVRTGSSPVELRSRDVAGRSRTCGASRFRRALYLLSYGHVWMRAPRPAARTSHCSGGTVLRHGRGDAPLRPSPAGTIDAAAVGSSDVSQGRSRCDVVQATRQPFDPGSPELGCASDRSASYVEGLWSPSPGCSFRKWQAKAHA